MAKNVTVHALPFLMVLMLGLAGCSTNYSTLQGDDGTKRVYAIDEAEAMGIAHNAILRSFPGRKIEVIDGPMKGYSTYTRVLLDTFTQQVLVEPVVGTTQTGEKVDGFVFEVSGSGSSGTGAIRNGRFFDRLMAQLTATGKAVAVVDIAPRQVKPDQLADTNNDLVDKILHLKILLDRGILTPEEFEEKKSEILARM